MFFRSSLLRCAAAGSRSFSILYAQPLKSIRPLRPLLLGSGAFIGLSLASVSAISLDDRVGEPLDSVQIDKSVDPVPTKLKMSTSYELIGYGTRSVTFLGFKVYALGIYAATEDISKISTVLDSKFLSEAFIDTDSTKSHSENVLTALKDADKSKILISNLLDSNIRLVARICPIRSTDFNHLRDGLVKSILAAKVKDDSLEVGLQELKDAFTKRGSVPKNHLLLLERLQDGQLQLSYQDTSSGITTQLGRVKTPLISKLLFLQYLSGGLSPSTKDTSIERISQLV